MTDPPRNPGSGPVGDPGPEGSPGDTPRWMVMLTITIATALAALIVLLHLTGTIGPGAH